MITTKLVRFHGNRLALNAATALTGGVRVEIQDVTGQPFPGFALTDSIPVVGEAIESIVQWKSGSDVGRLAGQPVRLRIVLREADLYSLRFVETA